MVGDEPATTTDNASAVTIVATKGMPTIFFLMLSDIFLRLKPQQALNTRSGTIYQKAMYDH